MAALSPALDSSRLQLPDPVGVAAVGGRQPPPPSNRRRRWLCNFDRRFRPAPTSFGLCSCAILFVSSSSTKPCDPFPFLVASRHPFSPKTAATDRGRQPELLTAIPTSVGGDSGGVEFLSSFSFHPCQWLQALSTFQHLSTPLSKTVIMEFTGQERLFLATRLGEGQSRWLLGLLPRVSNRCRAMGGYG